MSISHRRGRTLAAVLCIAAGALAVPGVAGAASAPHHSGRHRITINAEPNPITAGDPVTVFGRLFGPRSSGRVVKLYHHVAGTPGRQLVGQAVTDPTGAYEFSPADAVVVSNRQWVVASAGSHSRALTEHVRAQVTWQGPPNGSTLTTGSAHPYTFMGTAFPAKPGVRVLLQRQNAASGGERWYTIDRGQENGAGQFVIVHHFSVPGDANIRALVVPTRQNIASPSSPLTYQISQAQNPALTINASPDPVAFGGSVSITGVLRNGADKTVTLWAKTYRQPYTQVAQATTDAGGNYAFTQTPQDNTLYQVRAQSRRSAQLFEGVKDVLTAQASPPAVQEGQPVTFSGTVSPDKTGHTIYLQRRNASGGDFHTIEVDQVGSGSRYSIVHRFYDAGTKVLRILIPGGPDNQGTASGPLTVTVTPAPASALAPPQG